MSKNPRSPHRGPLTLVGDDPLPDVQVDGVDTVAMTEQQYTAAVHALATLIDTWRATTQTGAADDGAGDGDRPLAA